MIGVLSQVWKINPRQALERLKRSGYEFSAQQIQDYLKNRRAVQRLKELWGEEGPAVRSVSTEQLRAALPDLELVSSRERFDRYLGGRKNLIVSAILDQPGRLSGLQILDQKGRVGHTVHRPGLPPDDLGIMTANGFIENGRDILVVSSPSVLAACSLAFRNSTFASAELVGRSERYTGRAGWQMVAGRGRLIFCEPCVTASLMALLIRYDGRYVRMEAMPEAWRQQLAGPVDLMVDELVGRSLDWRSVLTKCLKSDRNNLGQQIIRDLVAQGIEPEFLKQKANRKLLDLLDGVLESAAPARTPARARLDVGRTVVEQAGGLYVRTRTDEIQISNLVVRLRRVVRLTLRGTTWVEGVVEFAGQSLPFFVPEDQVSVRWLRDRVMDTGLGIPVIGQQWGDRLLEISERLHDPELVLVRDDVGWDADHRTLVLPGYSIDLGGAIQHRDLPAFPGLPFTGGLGVREPEPLQQADLAIFDRPGFTAPISVLTGSVANVLLSEISGNQTRPTYFYGDAAVRTVTQLAGQLGCPVVEISALRDTRKLESRMGSATCPESRWPSVVVCRDASLLKSPVVRDWLRPGVASRFAVVNAETALVARAAGAAHVYRIDRTPDLLDAGATASRLFPAYLHDFMKRYGHMNTASRQPSRGRSFLTEILLDQFDFISRVTGLSDTKGRRARGTSRLRFTDPPGLSIAGDNGGQAEDLALLLAHWAMERKFRLVPSGHETTRDIGRSLIYDIETDRLIVYRTLLASLLAPVPVTCEIEHLEGVLAAAGRLVAQDEHQLVLPYGWWREVGWPQPTKSEKPVDSVA